MKVESDGEPGGQETPPPMCGFCAKEIDREDEYISGAIQGEPCA